MILFLYTDTHLFLHFKAYFLNAYYHVTDSTSFKRIIREDLPGTMGPPGRLRGFDPWSGNKDPTGHLAQPKLKNKN